MIDPTEFFKDYEPEKANHELPEVPGLPVMEVEGE